MVPAKIGFFLLFAMQGSYLPFLNVFLTSLGLSVSKAGLITGLRAVPAFLASPVWGLLADYTGRRKTIFILLQIATLLLIFSLPWAGRHLYVKQSLAKYNQTVSVQVEPIAKTLNITNDLYLTPVPEILSETYVETNTKTLSTLFYVMLALLLTSAIFDSSLIAFINAVIVKLVRSNEAAFGKQRMFGSLGFSLATYFGIHLAVTYHGYSKYAGIFYVFMFFNILFFPVGLYLLKQERTEEDSKSTLHQQRSTKLKLLVKTCSSFSNLIFFLTVLLMGIANSASYGFLIVLMESMGASTSAIALSMAAPSVSDFLVFGFAKDMISFLRGPLPSIEISIVSCSIRFISISYAENAWYIAPIQMLNGISYALFWTAAVKHTDAIAPKEIHTTMFALLNGVQVSLGILIGNVLGGFLYDLYGGRILFRILSVTCAVWSVVFFICYAAFMKTKVHPRVQTDQVEGANTA